MPNPWEMNWSNSPAGTVTVRPYTQQDASLPTSPDVSPNTQENVPWKMTWQQPEASISGDIPALAGKALTGIGQAATAPLGAAEAISGGADWLGRQISPWYAEQSDKTNKKIEEVRSQAPFNIPSPTDAVRWLASKLPQPKSDAGKIAGAAIEAIPSAVALTPNAMANVPNALNAAVRYGAVPAAAGEGTRQLFEGTALETPAAIAASLLAGAAMGMLPRGVKGPARVQSLDELRNDAKAAYDRVEKLGTAAIAAPAFETQANNTFANLAKEGYDPVLHPKAAVALRRMDDLRGQNVSFNSLETMRKIAKDAASSADASERRIGTILIRQIDNMVDNLPSNVSNEVREARNIYQRVKKTETVEELIQRAKDAAPNYSGSGYENAIRREFIRFVKDPDNLRGFSKEEIAALRNVAQGGPIENILRWAGKAAPTGIVSGAGSTGLGYLIGGPIGAAAVPAAGYLARAGATKLTDRNALIASELMRGGKYIPPSNSSAAVLYNALMQGK